MWARGITEIVEVDNLGNTPAAVDRETGTVYVNARYKNKLTRDQWMFVFLHELGHLVLQTTDEKLVDEWAFHQYSQRGYSLKESVKALTKVLSFSNNEHYRRAYNQINRAEKYDKQNRK